MTVLHDIQSPDDVRTLIDAFYGRIREDDMLGHIFNDIAKVDWPHHLPRMYAFWEFLLLGGEGYAGNPLEPHRRLNQLVRLEKKLFDRWVEIFQSTVDQHFAGNVAEEAKHKARLFALTWIPKFEQEP